MIRDASLAYLGYTDTKITDGGPTLDLKSYTQIDLLSTSARLRYLDAKENQTLTMVLYAPRAYQWPS